jgi:GT2 family glycosyltransferase
LGNFIRAALTWAYQVQVWEKAGGFIITRLGEDIEYSIRIHSLGFKIGLIPDAIVYHKRRTDFIRFYKQLHFFGRARINIYKFFPNQLKAIHFFPAVFTLGVLFTLVANLLQWPISALCNVLLAIYVLLIFFHSWMANKSAKIAFLSIIAAVTQLTAYGLGFMQDYWKRVVLKRS